MNMQNDNELNVVSKKLNFPDGGGIFVHRGVDGESVILNSSSDWSRKIGSVFRLHSSRSLTAPASLAWAQVPLHRSAYRLVFSAKLAVEHSLAVHVNLKLSADGKLVGTWTSEVGLDGVGSEISIPPGFEQLAVEVEALRFCDLKDGQVSVIDIEQIELLPVN